VRSSKGDWIDGLEHLQEADESATTAHGHSSFRGSILRCVPEPLMDGPFGRLAAARPVADSRIWRPTANL